MRPNFKTTIIYQELPHVNRWRYFPEYKLTAVVSADPKDAFKDVTQDSFKGKWKIYMWWPKDFTFVCPTRNCRL
jgi:alkyl hydroperoxide reductase subunit AhpC